MEARDTDRAQAADHNSSAQPAAAAANGAPAGKSIDWIACLLGLGAALAAWGVLQTAHPIFTVPEEYSIGMGAPNEARDALAAQQARVDRLNAAVILSVAGAALAALMTVTSVGCCGLPVRLLSCVVLGGLWGALTGFVGPGMFAALMPTDSLPSPANTGLAEALAFAVFGAGMGLLYGLMAGDKSALLGYAVSGVLAGAGGALAFPIVVGLVMPSASVVDFMPDDGLVRLLWLALPMVAIAVAVPLGKQLLQIRSK